MGHTHVTVTFRNPRHPERQWSGLCLVDTGATECLLPSEAVDALGLEPRGEVRALLADESELVAPFSFAEIELLGESTAGRVVFGPPGATPLLGVVPLESLGIVVDPSTRQIHRRPLLLKGAAAAGRSESHLEAA